MRIQGTFHIGNNREAVLPYDAAVHCILISTESQQQQSWHILYGRKIIESAENNVRIKDANYRRYWASLWSSRHFKALYATYEDFYYNKSFIIITKAQGDFLYRICFFLISRGKYFNLIDINKLLAVHMQNTDMLKLHFFRLNFHFLSCESTWQLSSATTQIKISK